MPHCMGLLIMKNISLLELIVIGIGLLAGCFAISKFVLCKFGMQTDFLSASATLFAAVVAVLIFNGWREPHKASKALSERNELLLSIRNLRIEYYSLFSHIRSQRHIETDINAIEEYKAVYMKLESNLLLSLDDLRDKLLIYKSNLKEKTEGTLEDFQPGIDAYISQLDAFCKVFLEFDPFTQFDLAHEKIVENFKNNFFNNVVISLTVDLRDFLIEQQKGH